MGDANEGKRSLSWMENLSLQTNRNRNPRDFLQRFTASSPSQLAVTSTSKEEEEEDEIELKLGLSLGGRFGVDKTDKKMIRSSSIAGTFPIVRDDDDVAVRPPVSHLALVRTSSLPVETEQEWRKRKELQTLRRMEAKRRRSEKQRILRSEKDGGGGGSSEAAVAGSPVAAPPLCGLLNWVAARKSVPASDLLGGSSGSGRGEGVVVQSRSVDSQGGSSSGGSESAHGLSSFGEASPASIQSKQERSHQEAACSSWAKGKESASKSIAAEIENLSTRPENVEKRGKETGLNSLEDMPCVFTQGDGPNGKRIEGILYKYGKGEEVRIMCVCHGRFLSPAEFVEHAGGTDVARPLRHIVVNPSSNSFL